MALFGFGKKKEAPTPCACGGQCIAEDAKQARLIVLGACCQKSAETFANVKQAAAELGLPDVVANVGDAVQIAAYGVMQTPALVIDGKVVSYGKLLRVEDAKKLIEQAGVNP